MSEPISPAPPGARLAGPRAAGSPLGIAPQHPAGHGWVARARRGLRRLSGERGAATAEYAVATMAAVGFAGLLVVLLRGDEVRGILTELVRNALTVG
ncbi:DUF4244 domain-containing protein [Agromyces aerolatus]|uniref:DUF4244 domain-containing protein n=1 Tax=Agromyces sp. LY-1074 TaxID=3074080 RepID=UPI00285AC5D4|nr:MULTISPECIES: DUF4244 domain-containing protein [unclassified Agromyces]MDR5700259.1 DUF4244 domain-containing protein [Agromyces sp. LY-1074]MDR5706763.1 DUF4244 domain-containing protein [Agromyces sp. LY-1358]